MEETAVAAPPRWVDSKAKPVQGLDLLALRRCAARISESLLDGVTTITPTIRYLSFMCWITRSYWHARKPDDRDAYMDFARRAEAAIVLANLLRGDISSSMVGSTSAQRALDSGVDPLPLEMSVQQLATSAYAAASEQNGFMRGATGSAVPQLTDARGAPLAELVHERASATRLGRRIESGETIEAASRRDLGEFANAVAMDNLPEAERTLLLDALLPTAPVGVHERNRVATYAAILTLTDATSGRIRGDDLLAVALLPSRPTPHLLDGLMDGWALFAVRDVIAAAHEAVLAAVLNELASGSAAANLPREADVVIGAALARRGVIDEELRELGLLAPRETVKQLGFREFADRVRRACSEGATETRGLRFWTGPVNEIDLARRVLKSGDGALGLLPVAWLLADHRVEPGIRDGVAEFAALSWGGRTRIGLDQIVRPCIRELHVRDAPFMEVAAELARRTVDQHLRTAWSRLALDPRKDVSLLVADAELWCPRDASRFRAGRAASRLDQAIGWMEQLGLTDDSGLTQDGRTILKRCVGTLEREPQS